MSKRYPGGLITKTPVTPTTSSAPGVWTLEQALQYIKAGTWPGLPDPYFPYVTMLLHGDGTNGAQNNTFLDSSTNNFTITRNGNTTQGSFSPYGSNWSNYFSGSGDYLTLANNSAFALPGDFTIELWAYFNSNTTAVFCGNINSSGYGDWAFFYNNAAGVRFLTDNSTTVITGAYTVTVGAWTHFAISRSGTSVKIFANGVLLSTTTNSSSNGFAGTMYIGRANDAGLQFPGYMSNLRIVKGTAVYTSAFTPSTTPLTAISGTSLLTCQSNRFIDNSTNAFAITRNGTPSVQRFSPFSPTAAYSTSTIGGSGYFDGSGDYLTTPTNTALDFGTGDFTVEFWLFPTPLTFNIFLSAPNNGITQIGYDGIDDVRYLYFYNGSNIIRDTTSASLTSNQWNHVVLCRSGTTLSLFSNGVRRGTATYSSAISFSTCTIGRYYPGGYDTNGYISDVRMVKGTAVYNPSQTTYTVPTTPLTAITNTSLLTNFTNGGIFDNAMMNNLETVGNAQISTSVFKYGTGSMAFDGSGDYLVQPYTQGQNFGTGNFTIEGWFYLNSLSNTYYVLGGTWSVENSNEWLIQVQNNGNIRFLTSAGTSFYSAGITTGTWYHFAAVRNGTTITLYINGTSVGSYTNSNSIGSTAVTTYWGIQNASVWPWNGYIDDLRITKGYARYTANFTPPTAAFSNN
jgi:hypothetical protein